MSVYLIDERGKDRTKVSLLAFLVHASSYFHTNIKTGGGGEL